MSVRKDIMGRDVKKVCLYSAVTKIKKHVKLLVCSSDCL